MSRAELDFLNDVREYSNKIFFLLNKADYLNEKELQESIEFLGEKIILKKMKEYLHQVIDIQSGRVRYDFAERLDKSKLDFRWEMLQRIEATIEGIEAAIKKGMTERQRGVAEVEERKRVIHQVIEKIDSLRHRLGSLKTEASE